MRDAETPVFGLGPILRNSVLISIRSDDLALHLHGLDIEVIVVTNCKEPNIFRTVFPIGVCATPFFTFPGDTVLWDEVFFPSAVYGRRTSPVPAEVDRGCWLQYSNSLRKPRIQPFSIFVERGFPEFSVVEVLRQVIGRIRKHQIH